MRPVAPLSLDLDNKWSYLKTHGDDSWTSFPSYLDVVVPRILDGLARHHATITVFIVGQDTTSPENVDAIKAVADAGHEIGNHSFMHEPWLHLYSEEDIATELTKAHDAIAATTGRIPRGFRGPGFSMSAETLEALARMGYRYDATIFPNALNPLGRAYYFMTSNLTREEREQRKALFGTFADAFRPNKPFRWDLDADGGLLEIPVTTMPGLRVPIHFSYLIYLAGYSVKAADIYFTTALWLCRRTGNPPSLLLHPLDYLGVEDEPDLGFFPGMKMERAKKLDLVDRYVAMLTERYDVVPVGTYAESIQPQRRLEPNFG